MMQDFKSNFLRILQSRGYIHQCTDPEGLDALSQSGRITAYIGFDCTAPSLHVGSLIGIMMLRKLQQTGHKPIVLMGGGTTRVGDPSGKDESRQLLTDDQISKNMEGIKKVFSNFLMFGEGETDAVMVNNADWLDEIVYIDFLRDYGRHFTINRMLSYDSVKLRLDREQPLSFLEFNYMILQAYDFIELKRRNNCILQMGGSDQWGNIVNGIDLGRRVDGSELFGLTTSLLTTASGSKMGKTSDGAIWLNPDMLGSYDYWQYWRNTEDADVGRFLRLFTELPEDEIVRLETLQGSEINEAKKILATQATSLAHGSELAKKAEHTADQTFEQGLNAEGLPTVEFSEDSLTQGLGLLNAVVISGLAKNNSEVRRLVRGGGIRINDQKIDDERASLSVNDLTPEGIIKISVGRKKHVLLKPVAGS